MPSCWTAECWVLFLKLFKTGIKITEMSLNICAQKYFKNHLIGNKKLTAQVIYPFTIIYSIQSHSEPGDYSRKLEFNILALPVYNWTFSIVLCLWTVGGKSSWVKPSMASHLGNTLHCAVCCNPAQDKWLEDVWIDWFKHTIFVQQQGHTHIHIQGQKWNPWKY